MKVIFAGLLVVLSTSLFANDYEKEIQEISKEIRRELYIKRHDEVTTDSQKVTKAYLDEYMSSESMRYVEEPLSKDEIAELYQCFHRSNCELYVIHSSSSYMSGYGTSSHYVLFYQGSSPKLIQHMTYAE